MVLGNQKLQELVRRHYDAYNEARTNDRSIIADVILNQITQLGGRFLRLDNTGIYQIDTREAKKKIMQCFRDTRKARRKPLPTKPGKWSWKKARLDVYEQEKVDTNNIYIEPEPSKTPKPPLLSAKPVPFPLPPYPPRKNKAKKKVEELKVEKEEEEEEEVEDMEDDDQTEDDSDQFEDAAEEDIPQQEQQ